MVLLCITHPSPHTILKGNKEASIERQWVKKRYINTVGRQTELFLLFKVVHREMSYLEGNTALEASPQTTQLLFCGFAQFCGPSRHYLKTKQCNRSCYPFDIMCNLTLIHFLALAIILSYPLTLSEGHRR